VSTMCIAPGVFAMLTGLNDPGWRMNVGKTLFAQVMVFVLWKTFGRT